MVTYSELIILPYCHENWHLAAEQVGKWLRTSGTIMRAAEKGQQFVRLHGTIGIFPFSTSVTFVLRFGERGVVFEGWLKDMTTYSIKPIGRFGKWIKAAAWAQYQSLVRALKEGSESSSLGP